MDNDSYWQLFKSRCLALISLLALLCTVIQKVKYIITPYGIQEYASAVLLDCHFCTLFDWSLQTRGISINACSLPCVESDRSDSHVVTHKWSKEGLVWNGKLCVEHITPHAGHRSLGYHAKSAYRAFHMVGGFFFFFFVVVFLCYIAPLVEK